MLDVDVPRLSLFHLCQPATFNFQNEKLQTKTKTNDDELN